MLVYGTESIEIGIARLSKFGYDFAEIVGEPEQITAKQYSEVLNRFNMPVSSIVSIYSPERDLVSSNPAIRANTIKYVKGNIDFAVALVGRRSGASPAIILAVRAAASAAATAARCSLFRNRDTASAPMAPTMPS